MARPGPENESSGQQSQAKESKGIRSRVSNILSGGSSSRKDNSGSASSGRSRRLKEGWKKIREGGTSGKANSRTTEVSTHQQQGPSLIYGAVDQESEEQNLNSSQATLVQEQTVIAVFDGDQTESPTVHDDSVVYRYVRTIDVDEGENLNYAEVPDLFGGASSFVPVRRQEETYHDEWD